MSHQPLPATDIVVNPVDGALYYVTGGRAAQSGVFRITYTGATPRVRPATASLPARSLRVRLEALHAPGGPAAASVVETAWPHLAHADRFVRHAARVAIEHQPVGIWRERALAESRPAASIEAIIALCRHGEKPLLPRVLESLGRIDVAALVGAAYAVGEHALADELRELLAQGLVLLELKDASLALVGQLADCRITNEEFSVVHWSSSPWCSVIGTDR